MLTSHKAQQPDVEMELVEKTEAHWIVQVHGAYRTTQVLDAVGLTPLPPYILKARGACAIADDQDRHWYQTIYANPQASRSVAAPTAGLHFTPELLQTLQRAGVQRIDVTLHVGVGTFKPVTSATLAEHRMHSEEYWIGPDAVRAVARLRDQRGENGRNRLFAVGTTSVRTLESISWDGLDPSAIGDGMCGSTDLLIAPPFEFTCVDGLLTNFHLPRSTLLALVAALVGLDRLKTVYQVAIDKGYRFYSYGDAMLILP
jgi:S-adenosylmethionine:tRNA ribosyltransferase-isomerase